MPSPYLRQPRRNLAVQALADDVWFAHVAAGSRSERVRLGCLDVIRNMRSLTPENAKIFRITHIDSVPLISTYLSGWCL